MAFEILSASLAVTRTLYLASSGAIDESGEIARLVRRVGALRAPLEALDKLKDTKGELIESKYDALKEVSFTLKDIQTFVEFNSVDRSDFWANTIFTFRTLTGEMKEDIAQLHQRISDSILDLQIGVMIDRDQADREKALDKKQKSFKDKSDFSYEHEPPLESFLDKRSQLGKSVIGITYRMKSKEDSTLYAIKVIDIEEAYHKGVSEDYLLKESELLKQVNHLNIVRFLSGFKSQHTGRIEYNIVMELVDGNASLTKQIMNRTVRHQDMLKWLTQTLNALEYLHNIMNVIHRDVRPDNILLTTQGNVKLDVGLSLVIHSSTLAQQGSTVYFSYEKMNALPYDDKDDMWSLGCVWSELLTHKQLQQRKGSIINESQSDCSQRRKDLIAECIDTDETVGVIIQHLLEPNPTKRPSAADCIKFLDNLQHLTIRHIPIAHRDDSFVNEQIVGKKGCLKKCSRSRINSSTAGISGIFIKSRYFILEHGVLSYYEMKNTFSTLKLTEENLKGEISLYQATILESTLDTSRTTSPTHNPLKKSLESSPPRQSARNLLSKAFSFKKSSNDIIQDIKGQKVTSSGSSHHRIHIQARQLNAITDGAEKELDLVLIAKSLNEANEWKLAILQHIEYANKYNNPESMSWSPRKFVDEDDKVEVEDVSTRRKSIVTKEDMKRTSLMLFQTTKNLKRASMINPAILLTKPSSKRGVVKVKSTFLHESAVKLRYVLIEKGRLFSYQHEASSNTHTGASHSKSGVTQKVDLLAADRMSVLHLSVSLLNATLSKENVDYNILPRIEIIIDESGNNNTVTTANSYNNDDKNYEQRHSIILLLKTGEEAKEWAESLQKHIDYTKEQAQLKMIYDFSNNTQTSQSVTNALEGESNKLIISENISDSTSLRASQSLSIALPSKPTCSPTTGTQAEVKLTIDVIVSDPTTPLPKVFDVIDSAETLPTQTSTSTVAISTTTKDNTDVTPSVAEFEYTLSNPVKSIRAKNNPLLRSTKTSSLSSSSSTPSSSSPLQSLSLTTASATVFKRGWMEEQSSKGKGLLASFKPSSTITNTSTAMNTASSLRTPELKRGWMLKFSRNKSVLLSGLKTIVATKNKNGWKSRYFVLDENYLFYYENASDFYPFGCGSLKGVINLTGSRVSLVSQISETEIQKYFASVEDERYPFSMIIHFVNVNNEEDFLQIAIETEINMMEWKEVLLSHIQYANTYCIKSCPSQADIEMLLALKKKIAKDIEIAWEDDDCEKLIVCASSPLLLRSSDLLELFCMTVAAVCHTSRENNTGKLYALDLGQMGLCEALIGMLAIPARYTSAQSMQQICRAIIHLSAESLNRSRFNNDITLTSIINILNATETRRHNENAKYACQVVTALALDESVAVELGQLGVCKSLVSIMQTLCSSPSADTEVIVHMCNAIANIACDQDENKSFLGDAGICEELTKILANFSSETRQSTEVVENVCRLLVFITDFCTENAMLLGKCGCCEVLTRALALFYNESKQIATHASIALFNLSLVDENTLKLKTYIITDSTGDSIDNTNITDNSDPDSITIIDVLNRVIELYNETDAAFEAAEVLRSLGSPHTTTV